MQSLRSQRRRPTHPGELLREDVFPALRLTQDELAERLGVSRLTVNELLRAKRKVSPEMAVRLARLLGTSPESWLSMQSAVDLWDACQQPDIIAVKPLRRRAAESA